MKSTNWPIGIGLWAIHLGALAVFIPGMFSWSALGVMFALWWVTGGIGISLCYHRLLTHRSLTVPKWVEYVCAVIATLSLQGGPIEWVSTHRIHHAHTDKEGDPHDAHRGFIWTHFQWLYSPNDARPTKAEQRRYAPDLVKDPFYCFLDRYEVWLQVALGVGLFAIGGLPWVVWGIFVRLVFVYHMTWFVNSASHRYGYQTFKTDDKSTNCWWVALLAWGEGWHNNHHAFPFSARHGLRWYEIDHTWILIRILQTLGLASDIKLPTSDMQARLLQQHDEAA